MQATFEPRRHFCPERPHDLVRRIVEGRTQLRRVRHLLRQRGHRLAVELLKVMLSSAEAEVGAGALACTRAIYLRHLIWRSDSAAHLADPSHCRPLSTATSVREPWRQPQDRTLSPLASRAVLRLAQLHYVHLTKSEYMLADSLTKVVDKYGYHSFLKAAFNMASFK